MLSLIYQQFLASLPMSPVVSSETIAYCDGHKLSHPRKGSSRHSGGSSTHSSFWVSITLTLMFFLTTGCGKSPSATASASAMKSVAEITGAAGFVLGQPLPGWATNDISSPDSFLDMNFTNLPPFSRVVVVATNSRIYQIDLKAENVNYSDYKVILAGLADKYGPPSSMKVAESLYSTFSQNQNELSVDFDAKKESLSIDYTDRNVRAQRKEEKESALKKTASGL